MTTDKPQMKLKWMCTML